MVCIKVVVEEFYVCEILFDCFVGCDVFVGFEEFKDIMVISFLGVDVNFVGNFSGEVFFNYFFFDIFLGYFVKFVNCGVDGVDFVFGDVSDLEEIVENFVVVDFNGDMFIKVKFLESFDYDV